MKYKSEVNKLIDKKLKEEYKMPAVLAFILWYLGIVIFLGFLIVANKIITLL